MYSIEFSGSYLYLLIIIPGIWILWFQIPRSKSDLANSHEYARGWVSVLQIVALLLLVLTLLEPLLVTKTKTYNEPLILLIHDKSSSYQAGRSLKIGGKSLIFSKTIKRHYQEKGFTVRDLFFNEKVWSPEHEYMHGSTEDVSLTNFSSLFNYITDSLSANNLQAVFLFTDGHNNEGLVDKQLQIPQVKVFPIVFDIDSINDIQLDSVVVSSVNTPYGIATSQVYGQFIGARNKSISISYLKNNVPFYTHTIEHFSDSASYSSRYFSFRFTTPGIDKQQMKVGITAVVNNGLHNMNTYNDTVVVKFSAFGTMPKIVFVKPLRLLDEKWMVECLSQLDSINVVFSWAKDLKKVNFNSGDQLWVSADNFSTDYHIYESLNIGNIMPVVYFNSQVNRLKPNLPLQNISIQGEAHVEKRAGQYFNFKQTSLSNLTSSELKLPQRDDTASCLVSAHENKKYGCLFMKTKLKGTPVYATFLRDFWQNMFNHDNNASIQRTIGAFWQGIAKYVKTESEDFTFSFPESIYDNRRFKVSAVIKMGENSPEAVLHIRNGGFFQELTLAKSKGLSSSRVLFSTQIAISMGKYGADLIVGNDTLWSDSVTVHNRASLENSKIGYNLSFLNKLAEVTKGCILNADIKRPLLDYPDFSSGHIMETKEEKKPLYNKKLGFFLILGLLSISWITRKWMQID